MKKFVSAVLVSAVISFGAVTEFAYGATLEPQAKSITQNSSTPASVKTKSGEASVVIVGQVSPVVRTYAAGQKLFDALEADGKHISDYRDEKDKALDGSQILESEKIYVLHENGISATSKKIDLKPLVVLQKTDSLYKGQTEVLSEGSKGTAIVTTVKTTRSSGEKTTEENLSIIKAPINKTTLIGTLTPPVSKNYTGRIFYRNDTEILKYALATNKDPDVRLALKQVGDKYIWAHVGPDSFDCSGLMFYVYHLNAGLNMPRTANAIGNFSTPVDWQDIKPGDVVWSPTHITMYIGNGLVVHAANHVVGVVISPLSYFVGRGFKAARIPGTED